VESGVNVAEVVHYFENLPHRRHRDIVII